LQSARALSNNSNYSITFVSNNFTITAKPITVTVNAGQSKVYNATDPISFNYTVAPALAAGDSLTGSLVRAPGEAVGTYAISQGTLANSNYSITFVSNNFTITAKPITVTANAGQTKVYGAAEPANFTYSITSGALVGGDSIFRQPQQSRRRERRTIHNPAEHIGLQEPTIT